MAELEPVLTPPAGSIAVFVRDEKQKHRIQPDDKASAKRFLTINGTPDAYRWLASILSQAAEDAEQHENGVRVDLDPNECAAITMTDWSALGLECRRRNLPRG